MALPIASLPAMNVYLCSNSSDCSPISVETELDLESDEDHAVVTFHIDKVGNDEAAHR